MSKAGGTASAEEPWRTQLSVADELKKKKTSCTTCDPAYTSWLRLSASPGVRPTTVGTPFAAPASSQVQISVALQILSFYSYLPEKLVGPEEYDSFGIGFQGVLVENRHVREERWLGGGFHKGQCDTKWVFWEDLVAVSRTNHEPHFFLKNVAERDKAVGSIGISPPFSFLPSLPLHFRQKERVFSS